MANTTAAEVYDSFESTFGDEKVIPRALELVWLQKAIGQYAVEMGEPPVLDLATMEFNTILNRQTIDLLGLYMKLFYQERQTSIVNKRASIVTKDFSYDGSNGTKVGEREHLVFAIDSLKDQIDKLKVTAYV